MKRRLEPEFAAYGEPYFNENWQLVRWRFERVLDVYETNLERLEPTGSEVYSTLRSRRMRPEYEWHPLQEAHHIAESGVPLEWRKSSESGRLQGSASRDGAQWPTGN